MDFGREDYNENIKDLSGRIPDNEPVFLLRAQDPFAPELLMRWAMKLRLAGGSPDSANSANNLAQKMLDWQREHGTKTPDMMKASKFTNTKLKRADASILKWMKENQYIKDEMDSVLRLFEEYYSSDDTVLVITKNDKKDLTLSKPIDQYTIEDFNIDEIKYEDCKLCIFVSGPLINVLKYDREIKEKEDVYMLQDDKGSISDPNEENQAG